MILFFFFFEEKMSEGELSKKDLYILQNGTSQQVRYWLKTHKTRINYTTKETKVSALQLICREDLIRFINHYHFVTQCLTQRGTSTVKTLKVDFGANTFSIPEIYFKDNDSLYFCFCNDFIRIRSSFESLCGDYTVNIILDDSPVAIYEQLYALIPSMSSITRIDFEV